MRIIPLHGGELRVVSFGPFRVTTPRYEGVPGVLTLHPRQQKSHTKRFWLDTRLSKIRVHALVSKWLPLM